MIYTESILASAGDAPLVGILTVPDVAEADRALLLLNSGLMHHVGTSNLSVRIARAVAEAGVAACRFDFSNIGDSPMRRFQGNHEAREVGEIREVMDLIERETGIREFYLWGLCSGADAALAAAVEDSRIRGIVQIDPTCSRTPRWYFTHYFRRLTDPHWYLSKIKAKKPKRRPTEQEDQLVVGLDDQSRTEHRHGWFEGAYGGLTKRGGRLLVVMTNGREDVYNYRGQFAEVYDKIAFGDLLEEHYFPDTLHIIMEPEDQAKLVRMTLSWVQK